MKKKSDLPITVDVSVKVSYDVDSIIESIDPDWEEEGTLTVEDILAWLETTAAEDLAEMTLEGYEVTMLDKNGKKLN